MLSTNYGSILLHGYIYSMQKILGAVPWTNLGSTPWKNLESIPRTKFLLMLLMVMAQILFIIVNTDVGKENLFLTIVIVLIGVRKNVNHS